jgi:hypothetical protein
LDVASGGGGKCVGDISYQQDCICDSVSGKDWIEDTKAILEPGIGFEHFKESHRLFIIVVFAFIKNFCCGILSLFFVPGHFLIIKKWSSAKEGCCYITVDSETRATEKKLVQLIKCAIYNKLVTVHSGSRIKI